MTRSVGERQLSIKSILALSFYKLAGYRPLLVPAAAWDRQFRSGEWQHLNDINQIGGLSLIMGYCQFLAPASILDVGCGSGSLTKNLRVLDYQYYLGIDISSEAVSQATQSYSDNRTKFAVAEATDFVPERTFDTIIFNQCAYYFDDPRQTILRYTEFLTPPGRIIVSMVDDGRTRAAWAMILQNMAVEDSVTVIQSTGATITKLLFPK